MSATRQSLSDRFPASLRAALFGPPLMAFIPAISLAAYRFGGETALVWVALAIPGAIALLRWAPLPGQVSADARDAATNLPLAGAVRRALDRDLAASNDGSARTAALAIEIDDGAALFSRVGEAATTELLRAISARLGSVLRSGDLLARNGSHGFVLSLALTRRLDLEALVQLAARLQRSLSDPLPLGGQGIHVTLSIGFCLPHRPEESTGKACLDGALAALDEARRNAPGAIRSFTPDLHRRTRPGVGLEEALVHAFASAQIGAWFQPQLSTDTGAISGMEALARWRHPRHGILLPGDFLPAVEALGLQRRLTEVILEDVLTALRHWDDGGFDVPSVAINMSATDLSDPMLPERLCWELDRHDLTAERLGIEVLETVIAGQGDEIVIRNLSALADMGCRIDLDDFGTGHAAIASIRRFKVGRIKIDRSLVTRIDNDPDQRTILSAILELADRLGVDTLAEGVETRGEHALLAQLGCRHVQGFSIARPMPFEDAAAWMTRHRSRQTGTLWPNREAG